MMTTTVLSFVLITAGVAVWLLAAFTRRCRAHSAILVPAPIVLTPFREPTSSSAALEADDRRENNDDESQHTVSVDDTATSDVFEHTVRAADHDDEASSFRDQPMTSPIAVSHNGTLREAELDSDAEPPVPADLAELFASFRDVIGPQHALLGHIDDASGVPSPAANETTDEEEEEPPVSGLRPIPDSPRKLDGPADDAVYYDEEESAELHDEIEAEEYERESDTRVLVPGRPLDHPPTWAMKIRLRWPFTSAEFAEAVRAAFASDESETMLALLSCYREISPSGRYIIASVLNGCPRAPATGVPLYAEMFADDANLDAQAVGALALVFFGLYDEVLAAFGRGPTERDQVIVSAFFTLHGAKGTAAILEEYGISAVRYQPILAELVSEAVALADAQTPEDDEVYSEEIDSLAQAE